MRPEPARPDEWPVPGPAHIPANSYWPFLLAIGILLFAWAPALFYMRPWVVLGAGAVMIGLCLAGWIRQIAQDWGVSE